MPIAESNLQGFWMVSGPYLAMPLSKRWRAEFVAKGRTVGEAGLGWAATEQQAREKAVKRSTLKNRTRTTR